MGMFDYLRCDYPLPDGRIETGADWQTKDGPCEMGLIVITRDGGLQIEVSHWVDVPEQERPYYGKPEWKDGSLFQFCGSMRRVVDGYTGQTYTGTVTFYRSNPLAENEWEEYIAVFVDGHIVAMRPVQEGSD